jgi:HEPN domain-containing protein
MQPDAGLVAEVREWLWKAAEDARAARHGLTARPPLTTVAVFHAQQSAEKAIKGFLAWHSQAFRKTHDLVELGEAGSRIEPRLTAVLRRAAPLTEFAWLYRYPSGAEDPTVEEAEEAIATAEAVLAEVLRELPPELRS